MATSTIDSIDWTALITNPPVFEQDEEVHDEWAEEITKKQQDKQETRTRQAKVSLEGHISRRIAKRLQDIEVLDSELTASRTLLNGGGSI